jgi:hypothetical protein
VGTRVITTPGGPPERQGNYTELPAAQVASPQIVLPYIYPNSDLTSGWNDEFSGGPDNMLERGWLVAVDSGGVATPCAWAGPVSTLQEAAPAPATFRSSRSGSTMFVQMPVSGACVYKAVPPDASGQGSFTCTARLGTPEAGSTAFGCALKVQNNFPTIQDGSTHAVAVVMSRQASDPADQLLLEEELYFAGSSTRWRYTRNTLQAPDLLMIQATNETNAGESFVPSVVCAHADSGGHTIMSRYTRGNEIGYPGFAVLDFGASYDATSGGKGVASIIWAIDYFRWAPTRNTWFADAVPPT